MATHARSGTATAKHRGYGRLVGPAGPFDSSSFLLVPGRLVLAGLVVFIRFAPP